MGAPYRVQSYDTTNCRTADTAETSTSNTAAVTRYLRTCARVPYTSPEYNMTAAMKSAMNTPGPTMSWATTVTRNQRIAIVGRIRCSAYGKVTATAHNWSHNGCQSSGTRTHEYCASTKLDPVSDHRPHSNATTRQSTANCLFQPLQHRMRRTSALMRSMSCVGAAGCFVMVLTLARTGRNAIVLWDEQTAAVRCMPAAQRNEQEPIHGIA